MTNVVAFPSPEPSTFAQAWDLLPSTMKTRTEAKRKVEPMWNREAKRLGGQEELLARLQTYLRDDKDLARSGGPGLQVLLRSGRLEHWVASSVVTITTGEQFPNESVRNRLLGMCGPAWVASYLDPATVEGTTVLVRTDYAVKKLLEHRHVFRMAGYSGLKKRV